MELSLHIGSLRLKNPLIAASGCFGYGVEYADVVDLSTLGAIVSKGLFLKAREGHPAPRIVETPAGMLNAIGLQGIGAQRFIDEKLPELRARGLLFVGLDVIGDYLTEINVTSPTCARELDALYGLNIADSFLDAVEKQVASS